MKVKVVNQVKLHETAWMMAEEIISLSSAVDTAQSIVVIVSYRFIKSGVLG